MSSAERESGELSEASDDPSGEEESGRLALKNKLASLDDEDDAKQPRESSGAGFFDVYGSEAASVSIQNHSIGLLEVQQLVTFVLADGIKPKWVHVKHRPLIRQVVLVAIPGLEWPLQRRCKQHMPFCEATFGKPVVCRIDKGTQAAGATLSALMTAALSKAKLKEVKKQKDKQSKATPPPQPPSHYVLDLETMRTLKYPVPEVTPGGQLRAPAGFVWTAAPPADSQDGGRAGRSREASASGSEGEGARAPPVEAQWNRRNGVSVLDMPHLTCGATMYALDCEMCITANGFELTRVSLVDHTGKCVLDELVVPDAPITDYNTQYSGITAEMLAGVKTRLPDIQRRLCSLVTESCILVGHSLENDFNALRFVHGNCIDTVQLYPHPKGLPYRSALRHLVERYLHRKIQQGSHDSVQDAVAAMELALLKIKNGPKFGHGEKDGEPLVALLSRAGRQCSLVDRTSIARKFVAGNCHAHGVETDDDAVAAASREIQRMSRSGHRPQNDFVFTRLLHLQTLFMDTVNELRGANAAKAVEVADHPNESARKKRKTVAAALHEHGLPSGEGPAGAVERALERIDCQLKSLWDSSARGTLFIAVSLGGNTFYTRWLLETKLRRQQGLDGLPPWSAACEEHYAARYDDAIRGCCYAAVKATDNS